MNNPFMFNGAHGLKPYVKELKGILMWNFWMSYHVGISSSNAYLGFSMVVEDVHLPT